MPIDVDGFEKKVDIYIYKITIIIVFFKKKNEKNKK